MTNGIYFKIREHAERVYAEAVIEYNEAKEEVI